MVKFAADRTEARLDVAKTLAVRQLSERHRQILIPARQTFRIAIAPIAGNALLEMLVGKELDQLGEDGAPCVHPALSMFRIEPRHLPKSSIFNSNRFNLGPQISC
jgi:hypothetical protein